MSTLCDTVYLTLVRMLRCKVTMTRNPIIRLFSTPSIFYRMFDVPSVPTVPLFSTWDTWDKWDTQDNQSSNRGSSPSLPGNIGAGVGFSG